MALIYSIGENLVSNEEVERLNRTGEIKTFINEFFEKNNRKASFKLKSLSVPSEEVMRPLKIDENRIVPHSPIGIGKPLTVYIQHIYLGNNGKKDLLVTSAMKSIIETKAASRAINLLRKKAKKKGHIDDIFATELGTPLIHYSPSLTESYTILTVEMILDRFNQEIFDQVGDVMQTAGAIPIFASVSQFLLGGGAISKIIGKLGESIFDGAPFFRASGKLTFSFAGEPQTLPGQAMLVQDEHEKFLLNNYKLNDEGKLVGKTDNEPYNGNFPYITLYYDGTLHDEYKSFKPLLDAIDILDKFYHLKTPNQQMRADALIDALKLYNDLSFRNKALELKEEMELLDNKESEEYKELLKKYEAYKKNIQTELFKIGEGAS